jgi:putative ABC transport system substrate-binding protein
MRRREFIALIGGAAAAWPLAVVRAQTSHKRPLIAFLSPGAETFTMTHTAPSFLNGMRDLGYLEGRNFDIVYRFSGGYQERLPLLAEELVRLKPDVILASAVVAAVAARKATSSIPIVCPALADAVHLGLVASEARPGGNVTGIEPYVAGLPAKQMELAREIIPGASTIGVLTNIKDPKAPPQLQELEATGHAPETKIISADANKPEDHDGALQMLAKGGADIVIVLQTSMLISENQKIADAALAKRLPTLYGYREHVVAGGLVSYGVDLRWCFHRAAFFVEKILHGTPPGDLPVEFPTKVLLSINLKTAKALGLHPAFAARPRRRGDRMRLPEQASTARQPLRQFRQQNPRIRHPVVLALTYCG